MAKVVFKQPHEVTQKKIIVDVYKTHLTYKKYLLISLVMNLILAIGLILTTYLKHF